MNVLPRSVRESFVNAASPIATVGFGLLAQGLMYPSWQTWCLEWGTTDEEARRQLPGDDLLPDADIVSTRSISICAPPTAVWPWLVQMGPGRGGAYSYDWIENLLGLRMHSANQILPQFQNLQVGDSFELGNAGPVMRVATLEPDRALVYRSDDGNWVWAFTLAPSGSNARLISRNRIRIRHKSLLSRALNIYLMEPGSLIMERKMLIGIKKRAESHQPRQWFRGLPSGVIPPHSTRSEGRNRTDPIELQTAQS